MRCTLAALAAASLTMAAWPQGEVTLALVNIEQVLREAEPVRAAIEAVDAEVAARQRQLDQRERELMQLIETYRSQSALLGDETRDRYQRDIVERRLELSELETSLRNLIDEHEQEVITPTFERIYEAIRRIAERNGIDAVLRSDATVYAATDLDITQEVIDELNREPTNLPPVSATEASE